MSKSLITILVALGVTLVVVLFAVWGAIPWYQVVVWIVVVSISLGIIGYAWRVDKQKRTIN